MSVIARSECPEHGTDFGLVRTLHGVKTCGHEVAPYRNCRRELVEVEYVPASQLRGAVEPYREAMREAIGIIQTDYSEAGREDAVAVLLALLYPRGGQSEHRYSDGRPVEPHEARMDRIAGECRAAVAAAQPDAAASPRTQPANTNEETR